MSSAALKIVPFPAAPRTRREPRPTLRIAPTGPASLRPASSAQKRPPFTLPQERIRSILRPPALPRFTALLKAAAQEADRCHQTAEAHRALDLEWQELRARLLNKAAEEQWSQRQLVKEAGLSWGGWCHLLAGEADLEIWIHRIRAAVHRLTASTFNPEPVTV